MNQIRNNLKELYFFYVLDKTKETLIAKGETKHQVKSIVKEKVSLKPDKYKNRDCLLLWITFDESEIIGDLQVRIRFYKIGPDLELNSMEKELVRYVIFYKKFLEQEGWNNQYLNNIAKVVNFKLIEFNIIAMPDYQAIKRSIKKLNK